MKQHKGTTAAAFGEYFPCALYSCPAGAERVCAGGSTHVCRKDCGGRVRYCHGLPGQAAGHLHQSPEGTVQPEVQVRMQCPLKPPVYKRNDAAVMASDGGREPFSARKTALLATNAVGPYPAGGRIIASVVQYGG